MEVKAYRKTQQNMLEQFFENYFAKSKINEGYKWTGIIFMVILIILMWMPYEVFEERPLKFFGAMWGTLGTLFYMNMYRFAFNGRGAITNVYQYLQYLPVSRKELKIFRLKKLLSLQVRVYLIAQVGQLLLGLFAYRELTWISLLLPLMHAFLAPVLIVGISILVSKN